ncbi:GTP binding protein [Xenoophorus captivus]|uniref:GTP binding protein n=1 Tax=Xenoophorus captivus TaxID=1517983 RepID=A0ABV0RWS9_9TELE
MDARVLELFGSTSGHGSGGSQGSASNHKPGNGNGVISKKAGAKNKKARARFPRNFKPSNNTPYLPPEVILILLSKLKLVNPTQNRFEHLATQMKWRLQEGRGEAVYQIGVEDNGMLVGLSEEDMRASLKTLHRLAEK